MKINVQEIPLTKINPALYNPRKDLKPDDPDYKSLKRSMEEFGDVQPLVWNKRTGNLVSGHQRFKILKEMGEENPNVVVVDLDDTREKALNIAMNKIHGDWDIPKLKDLLVELDTGEIDLAITGFDSLELKQLVDFVSVSESEEMGKTPDDRLDTFLNNNIKQIVLYFKADAYQGIIERLSQVCLQLGVEDNTEAFLHLLDFYEKNRS